MTCSKYWSWQCARTHLPPYFVYSMVCSEHLNRFPWQIWTSVRCTFIVSRTECKCSLICAVDRAVLFSFVILPGLLSFVFCVKYVCQVCFVFLSCLFSITLCKDPNQVLTPHQFPAIHSVWTNLCPFLSTCPAQHLGVTFHHTIQDKQDNINKEETKVKLCGDIF